MNFLFTFLLLLLPLLHTHGDQQTFDCKMRTLAVDFAHKIQPFRPKTSFTQLIDALNGAPEKSTNCQVQFPKTIPNTPKTFPKFPTPLANTFYVDTNKGNDNNSGTESSPFKTISKALESSRKLGESTTIILRAGTFYLTETLTLGPQDNGLTIQNYPNEEVWISGGLPLTDLDWQEYNVTHTKTVITAANENNVYDEAHSHGNTSTIIYLGDFETTSACQQACLNFPECKSYTFHTPLLDDEWAKQCFARIDDHWAPTEEKNINSGRIVAPKNIWKADLSSTALTEALGLRIDGKRAIRARYPNADPELGFGSDLQAKAWLSPTLPKNPETEINPASPFRDTGESFQTYQLGIGGCCKHFTPEGGYWCGNATGGGGAFTYRIPSGMSAPPKILPNSPYKNPIGAVVQTWRPAHWSSWMFEVGQYESSSGTFVFSKGGFQGARGNDKGDNFYIENVMEELDAPGEYFFDVNTKVLYLWYNGTEGTHPPKESVIVVPRLKSLVSIVGTMAKPVQGVTIRGVGFRDSAYTYLDPHGMPSGGDWGLERSGVVFLEGTEKTVVDSCTFWRIDGNGVMISGYNRYATVQKCEFAWIGSTAIASWGNAEGTSVKGMGWDGTNGEQPRFNQIIENFVHEIGIWEKQSSLYFQAKSCQTTLKGNIFFNGPRAGINFNDGFGGQSTLSENLVLNTCRESGDHGPFNSWDIQVYVTKVRNGTASVIKDWDEIYNNFMIANYNSQEAIDNDDGSCYYKTHDNFFAYSGNGLKSDFGGHDNHHYNNIYAYVGKGYRVNANIKKDHEDHFYNNTVILEKDGNYGDGPCSGDGKMYVANNRVYSPNAKITECGMTLEEWQAKGNDPGTKAFATPDDDSLVNEIKTLLGL